MRSEELGANNTDQAKEPYALPQVLPVFNGTEKSYPGKDYRIWDWASETWIETTSAPEGIETFESVEVDDPYYVFSANVGEVLYAIDSMGLMKNLFEETYAQDFIYQNRGKLETGLVDDELSLDATESFVESALGLDDIELTLGLSDATEAVELVELDSTCFYAEFCKLSDIMESKLQRYVANAGAVSDSIHLQIKINETGVCTETLIERTGYGYFGYGEHGYGGITYG